MKALTLAIVALGLFAAPAFADEIQNEVCNSYLNNALEKSMNGQKPVAEEETRAIAHVENVTLGMNLSPEKEAQLAKAYMNVINQNPAKIDDMGGSTYFICTTKLSAQEKADMAKMISEMAGL